MSEQRRSDPTPDDPDVWSTVQQSAEYQELRAARRRFLIPASVVYLAVYFGFLLSLGAPTLFQQRLHGGLNIGFVLMTSMFVLVWVGVLVHNSVARRFWDPRTERVRARAGQTHTPEEPDRSVTS